VTSRDAFSSQRLRLARERRGLTQTEFAARCGVARRTAASWELGEREPSEEHLDSMARVLRFPLAFFFLPSPPEMSSGTATFRSLSKTSAREAGRALAAGCLAVEFNNWIETRFDLPQPDLPDVEGAEPEAAAEAARAAWALGDLPIPNVVHLLEAKGVRVFTLVEETHNVDAFSTWHGDTPYVFLNTRKGAERSRMDAAHELAHLLLHRRHDDRADSRRREKDANVFASAFLMPSSSVLPRISRNPILRELVSAKRYWGVSVAALLYRINTLGMLTEWQNRQLWVELGKQGYRTQEPNSLQPETSQLLAKVLGAVRSDGMGLPDIAKALALEPGELAKFLVGLVPVALDGGGGSQPPTSRPTLEVVQGGRPT